MDSKAVEMIMHAMERKTSEELRRIYAEQNEDEWTKEAFEAIRLVLEARGESIPTLLQKMVVSAHPQKENYVRRWWITIVICICAFLVIAGTVIYKYPGSFPFMFSFTRAGFVLLSNPYYGLVGALHPGMSGDDVANALGRPCQVYNEGGNTGWTYLFYRKSGTNKLLVISTRGNEPGFGSPHLSNTLSNTINEWVILVPQSGSQPNGMTAYPIDDRSDCSVGQDCSLIFNFDERGVTFQGLNCKGVHYEVAKRQVLLP